MPDNETTNQTLSPVDQAEIDAMMAGPEMRQWDQRIGEQRALARQGISHLVEVDGVIVPQSTVDAERKAGHEVEGPRPHASN